MEICRIIDSSSTISINGSTKLSQRTRQEATSNQFAHSGTRANTSSSYSYSGAGAGAGAGSGTDMISSFLDTDYFL